MVKVNFDVLEYMRSLTPSEPKEIQKFTLREWNERWLNIYCKAIKTTTKEAYISYTQNHINRVLGDIELCKLSREDVQLFLNSLSLGIGLEKALSPKSIKNIHGILHKSLDVAEVLNVSSAQVGKIENIKHNAVEEVKEAVKNGDMTITTADSIAKLTEEEQNEIVTEKPVSEITTKDVKEHTEKKNKSRSEKSNTHDTTDNFTEESDDNEDDDLSDDDVENVTSNNFADAEDGLTKWESAIKGYALLAAERAGFTTEQKNALLGGMIKVLSVFDKDAAEKKYLNR